MSMESRPSGLEERLAREHLVNSVIVDTFIKAVRDYGDNKSSYREDVRHGLTEVAPLIVTRFLLQASEGCGSPTQADQLGNGGLK